MNEHSRLLSREYFLEHPNTYREYYELPADVDHELQRVLLNGKQIAFQYFFPEKCEQFVLFLHGFMDHVGPQGPFIHRLVNENIGVLAIDFPGHGLSEGDRYHIDDFNRYEEVLEEGLAQLIQRGYGDPIVIGHSTGGGIASNYLWNDERLFRIKKLVLVAPLARTKGWFTTKLGSVFIDLFSDDVPRKFRANSGDEGFVDKQRTDPLQEDRIPLDWVKAMVDWEKSFRKDSSRKESTPIVIFQGTEDGTVSWEYNLKFYDRRFANKKIILIDGGEHQLLNETEAIKQMVYSLIVREIKNKKRHK